VSVIRRSLVMFFPAWSVVAATWDESLPELAPGLPIAILESAMVRECSAQATAAGVRSGMKRREVHSVSPDVLLVGHNPTRDSVFFDRIRVWISHWVPQHAVLEPGLLAFQAKGLARFYGSEDTAARFLITTALSHTPPLDARVGVADDLFSAVMAAQHATADNPVVCVAPGGSAQFLAGQHVRVLGDDTTVSLLLRLGITTVGGFVALGEDAIRQRFGALGEHLYLRASGVERSRLSLGGAPVDPVQRIELVEPYALVDQVAFGIRADTEQYSQRLSAAGYVCTKVRIDIEFDQGPAHQRVWVHPRFFSAAELVDRVRWQLEQCARDTPTHQEYPPGVTSVTYHALDPEDLSAHEPGLWGSGPEARVHQVFSRVQGLVGSHGVLTAHTQSGRLPQDSQLLSAWGEKEPQAKSANPLPGALPRPLPATVFSSPPCVELVGERGQEVLVLGSSLSVPPVQMAWKNRRIRIESWAGPWPVCETWWDPKVSRYLYRLQLLDERGVGWLVVADQTSQWQLAARYD